MYRLAEQLPVAQGPAAAGEEVPLLGYTSIHVYIYIYIFSLSLSLSMYIYIYIERERGAEQVPGEHQVRHLLRADVCL